MTSGNISNHQRVPSVIKLGSILFSLYSDPLCSAWLILKETLAGCLSQPHLRPVQERLSEDAHTSESGRRSLAVSSLPLGSQSPLCSEIR